MISRRRALILTGSALAAPLAMPNIAPAKQAPGITDKEILLGQTMPYSGPASSYAPIGMTEVAYMKMINEQGGINGRTIKLLSVDDGYSPPKTVEQARKLVEEEGVAALFQPLGTPCNKAIRKYMNMKKVPQLFCATGSSDFDMPKEFPWTIGWQCNYQIEGMVYARYILSQKPNAKIASLYQNDDSGQDFLKGFKEGLGDKIGQLVKAVSYEVTDPTVDSQIVELQATGADAFFICGIPKFGAMALRKVRDVNWNPLYVMSTPTASVSSGIAPAGLEKGIGVITGSYMKDPSDPQWANDPGYKDWLAFMQKYQPGADIKDINNVYGYCGAQTGLQALKQCGNDLSRENMMKQAANLNIQLPMFHKGIPFNTTPTEFRGIRKLRLQRFDGKAWVPFGDPMSA
jgi:ABC-type branched-subunit amino acid transport system substrate-binding protein